MNTARPYQPGFAAEKPRPQQQECLPHAELPANCSCPTPTRYTTRRVRYRGGKTRGRSKAVGAMFSRRIPGAAQAAFLPIDSGHTIEARHRHWDRTRSFKTMRRDLPCHERSHERSGGRLGGVAHLAWVCLPHLRGIGVWRVADDRHRGARPP